MRSPVDPKPPDTERRAAIAVGVAALVVAVGVGVVIVKLEFPDAAPPVASARHTIDDGMEPGQEAPEVLDPEALRLARMALRIGDQELRQASEAAAQSPAARATIWDRAEKKAAAQYEDALRVGPPEGHETSAERAQALFRLGRFEAWYTYLLAEQAAGVRDAARDADLVEAAALSGHLDVVRRVAADQLLVVRSHAQRMALHYFASIADAADSDGAGAVQHAAEAAREAAAAPPSGWSFATIGTAFRDSRSTPWGGCTLTSWETLRRDWRSQGGGFVPTLKEHERCLRAAFPSVSK